VIKEPAGSVCCCVQRVLTTVEVSSASANGPQLVIEGLSDPMSFRDNVLKCKRDIIMAAGVSTNSHDMLARHMEMLAFSEQQGHMLHEQVRLMRKVAGENPDGSSRTCVQNTEQHSRHLSRF